MRKQNFKVFGGPSIQFTFLSINLGHFNSKCFAKRVIISCEAYKLYLRVEQRLIGDSTQYCILAFVCPAKLLKKKGTQNDCIFLLIAAKEADKKALQGAGSTLRFCLLFLNKI